MHIIQHQHQGTRKNQEDSLGYNAHAIIVCDGVGGHNSGEVASDYVLNYLLEATKKQPFKNLEALRECIATVQHNLNTKLTDHPEWDKMGTTLVGLFKVKNQWYSAHIGDSRLYWIQPSKNVFWHTWDHTFVANLVKKGDITREAGRKHPRGNEINRAIIANKEDKIAKVEINPLGTINKGSILVLCSDGVNEAWSDLDLITTLSNTNKPFKERVATITQKCKQTSADNNTAFFIVFNEDDGEGKNTLDWLTLASLKEDNVRYLKDKENTVELIEDTIETDRVSKTQRKKRWWLFIIPLIIIIGHIT